MPARTWIIAVAAALIATCALSVAGHPGADYRHSDFFQFWAAPRLLLEGADPYDATAWAAIYAREAAAPVATPPPPSRHVYPLWSAVLLLPFAALPVDVAAAAWLVGQVATVILALRALAGLMVPRRGERVLLFGLAAAFQPLWLIVGGGNVAGFLLGLFVAGLVATLARAPFPAGGAIGLLAVKPHPFGVAVPALLLAARPADRRAMLVAAAGTVVLLVAVTLPFGPSWTLAWLGAALDLQRTAGSNATVWTIGRVVPSAPLVAPVLAVGAVIALVIWWRAGPRPPSTLVAAAVAVSVFVAPHGWSYDQVLLLVPLAAILGELAKTSGPRRTLGLVLAAATSGPLPWALYAVALARGGEEPSALTPLAFFALLVLVSSWSGRGAARSGPELPPRQDQRGVA